MAPARLPVGCKTSRYSYNGCATVGQRWTTMKQRRHCIGNSGGRDKGGSKISTVAETDSTCVDEDDEDEDDDEDDSDSGWGDKHIRQFITDIQPSVAGASSVNYCYSRCCFSCCCSSSSSSRWYSGDVNGHGGRDVYLPGNWNYLTTCRRCLLRYFPFRRRSKLALILSLSLCVTVIKLFTATSTIGPLRSAAFDAYSERNDATADTRDREHNSRYRGLLSEPNCDTLAASDYQELVLTKAMLYRESRSSRLDRYPPADCSPTWFRRRGFRQVDNVSTIVGASMRHNHVAFLIGVDADSTLEQTLMLLGALHDVSDIYCLAVQAVVTSRAMRQVLRQVSRCLSNVIAVFPDVQSDSCKQRCATGRRNCACAKGQLDNTTVLENGDSSPDWECVRQLQSLGSRSTIASWTHLIKLSTFHLPIHPSDNFLELLDNGKTHNASASGIPVTPSYSTIDIESLNFTAGRAYSRQIVERLLHRRRHLANDVKTTRSTDSLGGSTAAEYDQYKSNAKVDSSSMSLASQVIELSTDKECVDDEIDVDLVSRDHVQPRSRCVYVVADLAFLAQVKTPFAYAFDIDRDHVVIRCVLERRRRRNMN